MKFGKSIGSQQDNHAGLHYIDYKLLKKRIKDVVECQQAHQLADALTANTAFEEELIREIGLVNQCFADQQQELLTRTGSLAETLPAAAAASRSACSSDSAAASTSASSSSGSNGGARTPAERAQAFRALIGILSSVDQLRKYAVWNAVAVVKILKKRRKQTSFGLEDTAAERAGWLSRQSFFSGSDFAELHAAVESLGHELVLSELGPSGLGTASRAANAATAATDKEPEQCPICLDTISDMVELGCNHRFCWKCFVLGPIAHQPGEYRITQCPICRRDTELGEEEQEQDAAPGASCGAEHGAGAGAGVVGSEDSALMPSGSEGLLTRFLHTYFPPEQDEPPSIFLRQGSEDGDGAASACNALAGFDDEEHESRDIVSELVRALLAGQQRAGAGGRGPLGAGASAASAAHADADADEAGASAQASGSAAGAAGAAGGAASSGSAAPGDFFQTLPLKSKQEKQMLGAAQKLQWLQLASTGDPLAVEGTTYCSLCSEPLLMEAVVSTPCKHYFHKVCVRRLDCPQCPLCSCALPFSWFVPNGHPCSERGFRVVAPEKYRPAFPGGPSKGSGGYPLRQPPPMVLRGGAGLLMKSYLHRIPPPTAAVQASAAEDDDENTEGLADTPEQAPSSASESSSEDSGSEDEHHHQHHHFRLGERRQAFGCSGRMRLVVAPATMPEPPVFETRSFNHSAVGAGAGFGGAGGSGSGGDDEFAPPAMAASTQQAPQVLLIGDRV